MPPLLGGHVHELVEAADGQCRVEPLA